MSTSKTKYLKCGLNGEKVGGKEITMGVVAITRAEKFRYLSWIIEEKGDIDEDINQSIRVGWQK